MKTKDEDRIKASPSRKELEYLAGYNAAKFPRPSVAVDVAIVTVEGGELRVLLARREEYPAKGRWALPGGFVAMDESLDEAAVRVLAAKGGLRETFLEQLYTFGAPERDPRTRVISVAYYALVHPRRLTAVELGTAPLAGALKLATLRVPWVGQVGGPVTAWDGDSPLPMAFDHADILGLMIQRLRGKLDYAALGFQLLPEEFTLRQLQEVHQAILGKPLNKDSFRRRQLASGLLSATGHRETAVGHRPAELYRFNPRGDK